MGGEQDFPDLMAAGKLLTFTPTWYEAGEMLKFQVTLDIQGVTAPLQLRGRTRKESPNRDVMLQIEHLPVIGKAQPLGRIDWRPDHQHDNKGRGPVEYRYQLITSSHHHQFSLNWSSALKRMVGRNLPIAVPIPEPSFNQLLVLACNEFMIADATAIPMPPWANQGLV